MKTTTEEPEPSMMEVESFLSMCGVLRSFQQEAFDADIKQRAPRHPRFRALVKRFAEAGFVEQEQDDFRPR